MKNLEQELKIELTERQYELLLSQTDQKAVRQVNFYFDCPCRPTDIAVRIREKRGEYVLCVKRRLSHSGGVAVSDEYECKVDEQFLRVAQNAGLSRECILNALGVDVDCNLRCVGSLTTYRTAFSLYGCSVEVDKNLYLGATDFELECENNDVSSLESLKSKLTRDFGISCKPSKSKAARFAERLANLSVCER